MVARRGALLFFAVQAALLVALGVSATLVYAVVIARTVQPVWAGIDVVLIAGCVALIARFPSKLGFGTLGERRIVKLVALAAIALAAVLVAQLVFVDANGVWLDEGQYLATLREGAIRKSGMAPFNMRWLEPFLAGPLNVVPLEDANALKAVNFAALVVTAFYLSLLVVRLGMRLRLAALVPVFLLCSYLAVYAGKNRLVLDPFNYAMFVLLFHTLVHRAHWKYFPIVLLIASLNSEKAIYWLPVFAVVMLFRRVPWREAFGKTALYAAPTVLYLIAIGLYLRGSPTEGGEKFFENLYVMAFSWFGGVTNETVKANTFQALWFPFGAFTIYALLALVDCRRWVKAIALLLIPIFLQALIAHDTKRMVAYAFIVYLPLGMLYLSRALDELPRSIAVPLLVLIVIISVAQYYLFPTADRLGYALYYGRTIKLALAAAEITVTAALVYLHNAVFKPS